MRDSVGGTFMIYVFIVFLAVYITFVAVAFNYARAFRVKNKVIDIIEQNEGIRDYSDVSDSSVLGQIDSYLGQVSYIVNGIDDKKCSGYDYVNSTRGYCIHEYSVNNNGITSKYYKVKTFIRLEIPFMNLGFTIPVKGETRKIERINS